MPDIPTARAVQHRAAWAISRYGLAHPLARIALAAAAVAAARAWEAGHRVTDTHPAPAGTEQEEARATAR
jgi:hypothetical protein